PWAQARHEVGILFAPKPRVHAAHGMAETEPQVTDAEPFGHKPVLGFDHVIVIVLRKFASQTVRWPRRFSGAERVWQDDEVFACVERLAGAEQLAREGGRQEICSGAAGAMEDQRRLSRRIAERSVMQAQFGHDLAGVKAEVARDPVALLWCRIVCGRSRCRYKRECKCACYANAGRIHWSPPGCDGALTARSAACEKELRNGLSDVLLREPATASRLPAAVFLSSRARTARRSAQ